MKEAKKMREITMHSAGGNDRQPQLFAGERSEPGGASDYYQYVHEHETGGKFVVSMPFVTLDREGATNEMLLAVVIDRLEGYQSGPFACEENALALESAKASLEFLMMRTKDRQNRGVENTHQL